ncbi:MAG: cytochrome c [Acidobacteriota bacterium]|nr:cytochrome c [Acidobacteriota bacterium]MDH3523950.1 cytochrome c [Acidobacteriota bacterium]
MRTSAPLVAAALALLVFAGCRQGMYDQARYEPYEDSDFFADGRASRLLVEGTVPRGWLRADPVLYTGIGADGGFAAELPVALTRELVERGRQRFEIFCSPCHGRTGDGLGMIVQRGFKQPASFHEARLRAMPYGYFFDVVTNGFGQMSSYASMVPVADRWAIAAYVRVLQTSRYIAVDELPAEDRRRLEAAR